MAESPDPVALEYFKALRSEIDLRIRNQAYYTISKIVACGALLGHLSARESTSALLVVPLTAALLDFIILHNLARINAIGRYIREELEGKALTPSGMSWIPYESCTGQTRRSGLIDLLDRFGQLGITVTVTALAILTFTSERPLSTLPIAPSVVIAVLLLADAFAGVQVRAGGRPAMNDAASNSTVQQTGARDARPGC